MSIFTDRFGELCRGKTLDEIAELTGVGRSSVHNYLRGNRPNPGMVELCKIADAFNVSIDWLAGRTPYRTSDRNIRTAAFTLNMSCEAIEEIYGDEFLASVLDHIVVSEHGRAALSLADAYVKTPPGSLDGFAPHVSIDLYLADLVEDRNEAVMYSWENLPKEALCALKEQAILSYMRDELNALREESR